MKIGGLLLSAVIALMATFNVSAMDDGCNQTMREPNNSVKKYNLQTEKDYNYQLDIWRLNCDDSMQILVKIYPKKGKTRAVTSYYDYMYIYQGGKQVSYWDMWDGKRLVTNEEPLFVQGIWRYNDTQFDFEMKQTVEAKVNNAGSVLLSGVTTIGGNSATNFIKGLTGAWYDPAYNGSGYNVVEAPNGLVVYFYGYKGNADGQAQWLVSDVGPVNVTKRQAIPLMVYSSTVGNGGSFTTKPNVGSGVSKWGTATVAFNSCNAGTITLSGNDGVITHNIVKLSNVQGLTCTE